MDPLIEDSRPRVLAVVVTSNGEPWLPVCLQSLRKQVYGNLAAVVVDSGSQTPPVKIVSQELPDASFVRMDRNAGFGHAANHALEISEQAREADYFLFLHDDVILEPEAVSLLIASAVETGAGVVGGKGLDWDSPAVLNEVGMSADQFGYPFTGLEEGEIDQGQHDRQRETLYVTNACMLVSRGLIERVGSWDGGYFAFGEDLDLCTRARLSGFKVVVQPGARFRHRAALVNQLRDSPATGKVRLLTRRNRMRTITKNSAAYRMPALVLLYTFLAVAEMVILAFFRRFEEIPAYPRAFFSFMASLPDVLRRRRAVQKRRAIPDRRIRRLMVRDAHRARVFFERRLRDWETGTLTIGSRVLAKFAPSAIKAMLSERLRRPSAASSLALALLVALATRRFTFGVTPVAAGSLWPFPEETSRLLVDFFSGWRDTGLGTRAGAPTSFPIMWLAGVVGYGRPILAQKVLMIALLVAGMIGMSRFISRRTSSWPARLFSLTLYSLGPATQAVFSNGDLAAMALFAGLPFMMEIALRMMGPVPTDEGERPGTSATVDSLSREAIRLGLVMVPVVALGPSNLNVAVVLMAVLGMWALASAWDRKDSLRRVRWMFGAGLVCLLVQVPWSVEAFRPSGAILAPLFSADTYRRWWTEQDIQSWFWLDPSGRLTAIAAVSAIVIGAISITGVSRRREARALVVVWVTFGAIAMGISLGYLPTISASGHTWRVVGGFVVAALAAHLVAGLREELPKHALGWRHIASPSVVFVAIVSFAWTQSVSIFGWDRPRDTFAAGTGDLSASISSYLLSTAEEVGDFRVLWLGDRWADPVRPGLGRMDGTTYFLTGPDGLSMLDAAPSPPSVGEKTLDQTVESLVGRRLHLAGHLLGVASVRFIIVDPGDDVLMAAMRRQRDIALEQQLGGIAIFRNLQWLPRASLAPVNLVTAVSSQENDKALMLVEWAGGRAIPKRSATQFEGELPRTRHSQILLGENYNEGWRAKVGDTKLEHATAFGWSNRFDLPPDVKGKVRIYFRGAWLRLVFIAFQAFLLALAIAASRPGRHELRGWLR